MPTSVLIVDDSALIRTSLGELLLHGAGVTSIREAATLGGAIDSVLQAPPLLVILDLRLPDGWGTDIIARLKQISPTLRIAMLTIYANPLYCQRCLALGADWFFDKASEIDALLGTVRQLTAPTHAMRCATQCPNIHNQSTQ